MPSGKPREKHYCWRLVSSLAEPTALAWHSRAQKPLLAKLETPHPGLPSFPPSLPLTQPQLGLANAGCQMGVGTRILWLSGPVHPSSMLVDQSLTQLPAWCLVWCKGAALWGRGARGGSRGRRKAAAAWLDTKLGERRNGVAAFIGQRRRLRLREAMSPAHSRRAGHQPRCGFCLVTDS